MKIKPTFIALAVFCVLSGTTAVSAQSVVINKYYNSGVSATGSGGNDDAIELLVIGNGTSGSTANLVGLVIKDFSSSGASDGGGKFTINDVDPFRSLRAGTLVILRNNLTSTTSADTATGGSDFILDVNLRDTTLFTLVSGTFDIAGTEVVELKAAGSDVAGTVGAIHTFTAAGATSTNFTAAPAPKLAAASGNTGTGECAVALNSTSQLSDFNSTTDAAADVVGGSTTIPAAPNNTTNPPNQPRPVSPPAPPSSVCVFGFPNTTTNSTFINSLRGQPTAATVMIEGRVTTPDGTPLSGVTLRLDGSQQAVTLSDTDGSYRFESVEAGGIYTVSAGYRGFRFASNQFTFSDVQTNTVADFVASPIKGRSSRSRSSRSK